MKIIRAVLAAVLSIGITAAASGCSAFKELTGGATLRILSGSENEALLYFAGDSCGGLCGIFSAVPSGEEARRGRR